MTQRIVAVRNQAVLQYLYDTGVINSLDPVIPYPTIEQVRGKRVFGDISHALAAYAESVTVLELQVPRKWQRVGLRRGMIEWARPRLRTYRVTRV